VRIYAKKCLLAALPILLIALAGCQSIGGVDLNKAWINQITVDSMAGKLDLSIEFSMDQDSELSMNGSERALVKAFNGIKIYIDDFKQEERHNVSMHGRFGIADGDIPFQATLSRTVVTLQIEGIKSPIIVPLDSDVPALPLQIGMLGSISPDTMMLQSEELTRSLLSLLLKHLPNPKGMVYERTQQSINGEDILLHKIHTDIKGTEVLLLFQQLLRGILKDDAGLKELITQIYEQTASSNGTNAHSGRSQLGFDDPLLKDRELGIEFMHAAVKQMLVFIIASSQDPEGNMLGINFNEILSGDSGIIADLYFDNSLNLRKTHMAFTLSPSLAGKEGSQITAIHVELNGEFWQHNQAVKADVIDTVGKNAIILDPLRASDEQLLQQIDHESILYHLLKDYLPLDRKTVIFYVGEDDLSPPEQQAIRIGGKIYVPALYYAERLGLKLEWGDKEHELILRDPETGSILVMEIGRDTAKLNEQSVKMNGVPYKYEDRDYIPLRFVSESFGAVIDWDPIWETATVTKG